MGEPQSQGSFLKPTLHSDPSLALGRSYSVFCVDGDKHLEVYSSAALSTFIVAQPAVLPGSRIFCHPKRSPIPMAVTPLQVWSAHPAQLLSMGTQHTPAFLTPRFLKGLPVRPAPLSDKLKAALGMDPTPGGIKYIIATQVSPHTSPQPRVWGPHGPAPLGKCPSSTQASQASTSVSTR